MTDTSASSAAPTTYSAQFIVTADYPSKAATAFVRFSLSRPRQIVFWCLCGVIVLICILEFALGGTRDLVALWFPIALIGALALGLALRRTGLRKQLATNARPGAVYELTLTTDTLSVQTPVASSSVKYNYYEKLDVQGDFVFLKIRHARIRSIMPRQLFTPEALEYVRSRVEN